MHLTSGRGLIAGGLGVGAAGARTEEELCQLRSGTSVTSGSKLDRPGEPGWEAGQGVQGWTGRVSLGSLSTSRIFLQMLSDRHGVLDKQC